MFGFQRRLVRRWECETFMPKPGFLPQISQTDAIFLKTSWTDETRDPAGTGKATIAPR